MSRVEDIKQEVRNTRDKYIAILQEVFEEEFPKHYTEETMNDLIKQAMQKDIHFVEIHIMPFDLGDRHLSEFSFVEMIRANCFKKSWSFLRKQVKYNDTDLEELVDQLELFNFHDYDNAVKDTISNTRALEQFVNNYRTKGYEVEMYYHSPDKADCVIRLSWK